MKKKKKKKKAFKKLKILFFFFFFLRFAAILSHDKEPKQKPAGFNNKDFGSRIRIIYGEILRRANGKTEFRKRLPRSLRLIRLKRDFQRVKKTQTKPG